jgi:hypothetical protein
MAASIKITDTFQIVSGEESYKVQEHTRCSTTLVHGVKKEQKGRIFYKTEDGRGVLKNADNDTYAIPSLGIKAAKRKTEAAAT